MFLVGFYGGATPEACKTQSFIYEHTGNTLLHVQSTELLRNDKPCNCNLSAKLSCTGKCLKYLWQSCRL